MKKLNMDIIRLLFCLLSAVALSKQECLPTQVSCEFWLNVHEKMTMVWKNIRVHAFEHKLYRFDETPATNKTKIPEEEVVTADGFDRAVMVVNDTLPGPPIVVYEGQEVVVHVNNHLLSESITIHWHGLHQKGTPFMDGVAYITQCPVSAGQTFTYRFKAKPKGTFWYHSHIGGQRVDGVYGAFIVKERTPTYPAQDMVMHVGDWFHSLGSQLHTKMISGYFKSQPKFVQQKTVDGVYFAPVIFKSALIEGRGQYRYRFTGNWTETPYKRYNVENGKQYRFRVIGNGVIYPFRVSVDGHAMQIVATDGYDVKPRVFDSFIINPGERYDFIITANQTKEGEYWIRAQAVEDGNPEHYARAIISYDHNDDIPKTNAKDCTKDNPCTVLNCPFTYYPPDMHMTCVKVSELESLVDDPPPEFEGDSVESFMNFAGGPGGMNVNARLFLHPGVSSLTQSEDVSTELDCATKKCDGTEICRCEHELKVEYGKTVQMVWSNHGFGSTRHHPIHLHGHSFHVLKLEYGVYNQSSALLESNNRDIDCRSTKYCADPTWWKNSWKDSQSPGLNVNNPPRKDTLMIPVGAYAVIRFKADNPGKWFMHCHIEFHSMQGMAMILNEAEDMHVKPPKGFPVCQNFHFDESKDIHYEKPDESQKKETNDEVTRDNLVLIIIILGCLSFVLLVVALILCCMSRRKGVSEKPVGYSNESMEMKT